MDLGDIPTSPDRRRILTRAVHKSNAAPVPATPFGAVR